MIIKKKIALKYYYFNLKTICVICNGQAYLSLPPKGSTISVTPFIRYLKFYFCENEIDILVLLSYRYINIDVFHIAVIEH